MSMQILPLIRSAIKLWYIPLIIGVFFVFLAIVAFISPTTSLLTLGTLFSLTFMVGGVAEILFSIENSKRLYNWGWALVFGIVTLVIGILLFLKPEVSILTLSLYVGFLILFRSISAISFALDIKRYGSRGWGGLLILGILGLIASFILLWNPALAAFYIVLLVALNVLFAGFFSIYFSLELRKLNKMSKELSPEIHDRILQLQRDIRNDEY